MAVIHCNFYSQLLSYDIGVNVILPENRTPYEFVDGKPYCFQVLYLLHGRGDNCNGWIRGTSIERYALEHRIAVIMPSGEDSFYVDSVHGKRYFSYMTEELPTRMKEWFPISDNPADTFIAGLSMGGYGALKIGLTYPERYGGIGIFSAVTIPKGLYGILNNFKDCEILKDNLDRVFGRGQLRPEDNPMWLLESCVRQQKKLPLLVQYEGKQDMLYEMNREFYCFAASLGQKILYEEWEGGHDWKFWDQAVEKALETFPLKNNVVWR